MKSQVAVLFYTGVLKINKQKILCKFGNITFKKLEIQR